MVEAVLLVALQMAVVQAVAAHLRGLVFLLMPYRQHWTSLLPRRRLAVVVVLRLAREPQAIILKSIYRLAKPKQAR